MSSVLYRLGRFCYRHHYLVLLAVAGVLALAGLGALTISKGTQNDFRIPGTEAQQALDALAQTFPQVSGAAARVIVILPEGQSVRSTAAKQAIEDFVAKAQDFDGVAMAVSPFSKVVSDAINKAGNAAIVSVQYDGSLTKISETAKQQLVQASEELQAQLGPGARVSAGGDIFTAIPHLSWMEGAGLLLALVVLLVMFRRVLPALLPLVSALVGVAISAALIYASTAFFGVSSTAPLLAIMIGLALGIDYSLFILSRHNDQVRDGMATEESAARATATAGSAVVFAGLTVAISLVGLAVARIPFLAVMGVAAGLAALVAVFIALTLVPALMGFLGTHLHPRPRRMTLNRSGEVAPRSVVFTGWVRAVTRHPVVTVVIVVAVLLVIAFPAKDLHLALPNNGTAEAGSNARVTYDLIAQQFGAGYNGPLLVTASIVTSTDPLGLVEDMANEIRSLDGVASVPLATPNQGADTAIIQVVPTTGPSDERTAELVRRLRDLRPQFEQKHGVKILVTGFTAAGIDISQQLGDALLPFAIVVVGFSLILLGLVFRSIAVPLKATLGYLLSIGAAFGLIVVVFDWGWFAGLLNVAALGSLISFLPIILMGVLFGLAMDYEVFLVSRMHELHTHGKRASAAIEEGFVSSAPVVTSAALIMFGVFLSFVPNGDFNIKPIAFGLTVGVFIDAFVVRMTLVPAVMAMLGERAWWMPRWLERRLPHFDVEGEGIRRELELADWPEPGYAGVVAADGLTLSGADGDIYRDVSIRLEQGGALVVQGDHGCGKTELLLTVAGRMAPDDGLLRVCGRVLPAHAAAVRGRVGVVRCADDAPLGSQVREALRRGIDLVVVDDVDALPGPQRHHLLRHLAAAARRQSQAGRRLSLILSCRDAVGLTAPDGFSPPQLLSLERQPQERMA
jgi:RND superfamily putative drug exporter